MEAYPRQVLQPVSQKDELMSDAAWLQGFTIGAAANKRLAGLPDAQREQFLGLFAFEPTQFVNCESGRVMARFRLVFVSLKRSSVLVCSRL